MPKLTVEFGTKELTELLFQLSPSELSELMKKLRETTETFGMMRLAEFAFAEWDDPEEDIYNE